MIKDLTGERFSRLLVLGDSRQRQCKKVLWLCQCDCGKQRLVTGQDLLQGKVRSCGCLLSEMVVARNKKEAKHNSSKTRLYKLWVGMKNRCYNQNSRSYKHYGGRGISVCPEWLHNFPNFQKWALGNGYKEGLSLEREDINKGYSPDNCTWIPFESQCKNKQATIRYKGEPLREVARRKGIKLELVYNRIRVLNWPIEEALELVPHVKSHERFLQSKAFVYYDRKKRGDYE